MTERRGSVWLANKFTSEKIPERQTWGGKLDFLLSVIGFAVDLGNVQRFPYICYKNGGGAFLIPYFSMLAFVGLPLFYMELALGQFQRTGAISVWLRICPMFCGMGYGIIVVATLVGAYYNTMIGWAFYFLVASFEPKVPWGLCNQTWNTPDCVTADSRINATDGELASSATEYFDRALLEVYKSTGIGDLGSIRWSLAMCMLLMFVIIFLSLWKGIKQSGKVVWVTATAPFIILIILLVRGCTLPGAMTGIKYFLYPNFDTLLTSSVWIDAAAQIFFSLGPGFGAILTLASYNKFNNNCFRDAMIASAANSAASLLSGFVVFSVLGYMADLQHTTIDKVAVDGPGLVFIAYPQAIATLAGSNFWAVLLFFMFITLGLDSSFGGLETAITAIIDQYPQFANKRPLVLGLQLGLCFLIGLLTVTYGGTYVIFLMDMHSAPITLIFFCLVEVVAVNWIYGFRRFLVDIEAMLGYKPGYYWIVCWVAISPLTLMALLFVNVYGYQGLVLGDYVYPAWAEVIGWCLTMSSILCVPGFMIYWFGQTKGTFKERMLQMIRPVEVPKNPATLGLMYSTDKPDGTDPDDGAVENPMMVEMRSILEREETPITDEKFVSEKTPPTQPKVESGGISKDEDKPGNMGTSEIETKPEAENKPSTEETSENVDKSETKVTSVNEEQKEGEKHEEEKKDEDTSANNKYEYNRLDDP